VITAIAFVFAAAAGTVARADIGQRWNRHEGFPAGTLAVNVVGSFLLGLSSGLDQPAATVIGVGGIGALTTFSSLARDAVALAEQGQRAVALGYLSITVGAGVAAAAAGVALV
jgi:fluoride exporter